MAVPGCELWDPSPSHGPQIAEGTITITFVEPHTFPSSLASRVVSPFGLVLGVASVPRTLTTISPVFASLEITVAVARTCPVTTIWKSFVRLFGATVIVTCSKISFTQGSSEELLDELPPLPEALPIPVFTGEGEKLAEHAAELQLLLLELLLEEDGEDEEVLDEELDELEVEEDDDVWLLDELPPELDELL